MPATTASDIGTLGFGIGTGTGANREDLLDLISNIAPWDTPFMTLAAKTNANGITHAWLYETLAATSTAGAVEGADWALSTATTRPVRDSNLCMILRKDISISLSQMNVDSAGARDMYQREVMKATREIARNWETICFQSTSTGITGATDSARAMRGFLGFLTTTATALSATGANAYSSGASTVNLGTGIFNDAMTNAYLNGAEPGLVFCAPIYKRNISQFTAPQQNRNIAAAEKSLINSLDIYRTDVGDVHVILDRWCPYSTSASGTSSTAQMSGQIFFITRQMARIAYLRPVMHTFVGKRGDSVAGMVLGEGTLEVLNPSAHLRLSGLASS